jgi:hypothetical protein
VRFFLAGLALSFPGCDRGGEGEATSGELETTPAPRAPPPVVRVDDVLTVPLMERNAFDLLGVDGGVVLVTAGPGGGLEARRIHASGRVGKGTPFVGDTGGSVVEVVGAGSGGDFAVAWIAQKAASATARIALGRVEPLTLAVPLELGDASVATTDRGHLALASLPRPEATGGPPRFAAFHRGARELCDEDPRGCTAFPLHVVDFHEASPRRVLLSVPAPCGRAVAGFVTAGDRWYYGVCALKDGRAETTVFTIEHLPEYAQAELVLPGCVPIGMTARDEEAIVVGQCGRERRATRVGRRERPGLGLAVDDARLGCEAGGRLRVETFAGATLELGAGDVAALLAPEIAPAGARAVMSSGGLFVGSPVSGKLVVRRHHCAPD